MARSTRYGISDVWLADDGPVVVAYGDHVVFRRPGQEAQTIALAGHTVVPSRSRKQVLIGDEDHLALLDWSDGLVQTPFTVSERLVLPTSFDQDAVYLAAGDKVHRCRIDGGELTWEHSCDALFPAAVHPLAENQLWVMGSTPGAARQFTFALPELSLVEESDVTSDVKLRHADKLAMKQAHVGDVVDVDAIVTKALPLEWAVLTQVPPITTRALYLIETSIDDEQRILARPKHYLSAPSADWRYPIDHTLDVSPRMDARGRFVAIATGSADTGTWAVVDIETGEELAVRSRPLSDVPCLRICGNHLAVAWTDGEIEVVGLPVA